MMKFDLHVHSKYSSDGVLDPENIVRIARKRGLAGIAVTDHNTIRGGIEAARYASDDFQVIPGAEILTDHGEVIGLFLSREIKPSSLDEVIRQIREQGGMVIVPHPFDKLRHNAFALTTEHARVVDAIEAVNARCVFSRYNKQAMQFAVDHDLPVVGGSDAHFAQEIGLAGIQTDSTDIRKAILGRNIQVYGRRSSIVNHVRTKALKWSRRNN